MGFIQNVLNFAIGLIQTIYQWVWGDYERSIRK